jgi:hypothetical protein
VTTLLVDLACGLETLVGIGGELFLDDVLIEIDGTVIGNLWCMIIDE